MTINIAAGSIFLYCAYATPGSFWTRLGDGQHGRNFGRAPPLREGRAAITHSSSGAREARRRLRSRLRAPAAGLPIAEQLVSLLGGQLLSENARMPQWAWRQAGVAYPAGLNSGLHHLAARREDVPAAALRQRPRTTAKDAL